MALNPEFTPKEPQSTKEKLKIAKEGLRDVVQQGAKNLKGELSELKEKVGTPEGAMEAGVYLATLAISFGLFDDEIESKKADEKRTPKEEPKVARATLTSTERRESEKADPKETEPNPNDTLDGMAKPGEKVDPRMAAVNFVATKNKRINAGLKAKGIELPKKEVVSRQVFKEGLVPSFEEFKDDLGERFFPGEADTPKRTEKILAVMQGSAIGTYQILGSNFKGMGWPMEGEDGLRAIYDFIRSTNRQRKLHRKMASDLYRRQGGDLMRVAIGYYAGEGMADLYRRDPNAPALTREQPAGKDGKKHASIKTYAQWFVNRYNKTKAEYPQLSNVDLMEVSFEGNETGGKTALNRILKGGNGGADAMTKLDGMKGYRMLNDAEGKKFEKEAQAIFSANKEKPYGTVIEMDNGYVARIEEHTNRDPSGAPGVTLYKKTG